MRLRCTLLVCALLCVASGLRAETVNCTAITTLPAVITVQGLYCFTGDLATAMTTGNAIDIQTSNVVIDLNGHKLGGLAAGVGTQANGIHAEQRKNITIRNGTVRGFMNGISLYDTFPYTSAAHLIENIRADFNTQTGILVYGQASIIQANQVVSTGGTTAYGPNASANGLYVFGAGARVLNNDVVDTFGMGTFGAYSIFVLGPGIVVENNRVSNSTLPVSGTSTGIEPGDSNTKDTLVVNNRLTTLTNGIVYAGGATGKYRDNLTSNVTTPFINGTNAGNNN